jgi:hypothetical protein
MGERVSDTVRDLPLVIADLAHVSVGIDEVMGEVLVSFLKPRMNGKGIVPAPDEVSLLPVAEESVGFPVAGLNQVGYDDASLRVECLSEVLNLCRLVMSPSPDVPTPLLPVLLYDWGVGVDNRIDQAHMHCQLSKISSESAEVCRRRRFTSFRSNVCSSLYQIRTVPVNG